MNNNSDSKRRETPPKSWIQFVLCSLGCFVFVTTMILRTFLLLLLLLSKSINTVEREPQHDKLPNFFLRRWRGQSDSDNYKYVPGTGTVGGTTLIRYASTRIVPTYVPTQNESKC